MITWRESLCPYKCYQVESAQIDVSIYGMVHQFSSGTYSNLFGAALRAPGRITCFTPMVANPVVALFPGTAPPRTGALLSYSRAAPCQRYVSHVTVAVALSFGDSRW